MKSACCRWPLVISVFGVLSPLMVSCRSMETSAEVKVALEDQSRILDIKKSILDAIHYPAALFGHMLGFTYAAGTAGVNPGEDMSMLFDEKSHDPTGWVANYRGSDPQSKANMASTRLEIRLVDWVLTPVEFTMDSAHKEVVSVQPEVAWTQSIDNSDSDTPLQQTLAHQVTKTDSITKSTNSKINWGVGASTTFKVGLEALIGGGVTTNISFGGEQDFGTTSQTTNTTTDTSTGQVTVGPRSKVYATWLINRQVIRVPYTAKIQVNAKLKYSGLIRSGDWKDPKSRNYSYQFHDSKGNYPFTYTFGTDEHPFFEDINNQNSLGSQAWMWKELRDAWGAEANDLIAKLDDPKVYTLTIKGTLEYSRAMDVQIKQSNSPGKTADPKA